MFTVECPGCRASYQVDERRVPAGGLRMRCPKCSTAFVVEKPSGAEENPASSDLPAHVLPAAGGTKPFAAKPAPPRPVRPPPVAASAPLPDAERPQQESKVKDAPADLPSPKPGVPPIIPSNLGRPPRPPVAPSAVGMPAKVAKREDPAATRPGSKTEDDLPIAASATTRQGMPPLPAGRAAATLPKPAAVLEAKVPQRIEADLDNAGAAALPAVPGPTTKGNRPATTPLRDETRKLARDASTPQLPSRTALGLGADEPSGLPAIRHSPTERDLRAAAYTSADPAQSSARLTGAALGAPTEPMLPVAADVSDYGRDSDLPAALGATSNFSMSARTSSDAALLPARYEAAGSVDGWGADKIGLDDSFGGIDLNLLPDIASKAGAGAVDIELELPSPLGPVTAPSRSKAQSIPPMVDDFEFELPSPTQAQLPAGLNQSNQRAGSGHLLGDLPDVNPGILPAVARSSRHDIGELPDLDVGLPQLGITSVGLPQIQGASGHSSKTLAGTGSIVPGAQSSPPSAIPELDLGWGPSGSVPPASSPSEPAYGSLPPAFGMGAPSSPSLPPALGGNSPARRAADSLPPLGSLGVSSQAAQDGRSLPNIAYRPDQGSNPQVDNDMELSFETNSIHSKRSPGSVPPGAANNPVIHGAKAGGTSYGEVSLDTAEDTLAVDTDGGGGRPSLNSSEVLEFGGLPQSDEHSSSHSPGLSRGEDAPAAATAKVSLRQDRPAQSIETSSRRLRARHVVLGLLAATITAGAALSLSPDIGFFGSYFIIDQVKAKENAALVRSQISAGGTVLARDDYSGVVATGKGLEKLRREHGRVHALSSYFAYFSYSVELRYGSQPQFHGAAEVAINELKDKRLLPYWGLAEAVRAAVDGNLARARRDVDAVLLQQPRSVDAIILSAEIALLERRAAEALQPWKMANNLQPSARTAFGLARTYATLGQSEDATKFAKEALAQNANHVGAALLLARLALDTKVQTAEAERLIQSVLSRVGVLSTSDFVQAKTLSGDSHLLHSRISLAESSYQEALDRDPKAAAALRGLGETLYRAGRYAECLARFEAALQADPDDIDAAVGAAKAQLSLERIRDALTLLTKLRQSHAKSYGVNYWYGRANEAGGNRDEAEKAYAAAIEAGGDNPIVVDAYVGLALVKNQQGRREEAQNVLVQAQAKLPKLPKIYEALGQLALAEGRYAAAVEQFEEAQRLDPSDVGIRFRLGAAHRKNREFEAAAKCFDEVAAVDRDYPGLALERGQLYESSGRTEEALRAFESALAKAPTDPDLMLRVGCGKVVAGRPEQAEQLLKKVLEQRPTSAETHHCLGRAQLLEGSNLALALRTLQRAVELDPHRAEYHLYVGWVANEVGKIAEAESSLKKALELDQGLGDAYWQRGILRYRQGAIKDAVVDLTRALELRPGRYEAHAALADAYFDLGLEAKALDQWAKATTAQPDNATWAYRFGKLLQGAHRDAESKTQLEKSIELAEKLAVKPRWIWDAHYLMARALGQKPAAVKHWKAFLDLAPSDNVYREEATVALQKLGQPRTAD